MKEEGNEEEGVVVAQNLTKRFGDFVAVNDISFNVRRNTIFGLLGSNGAGKSTTMNMLTGLLNPTEGEITILGEKVKKKYSRNLKRKVAIVPQEVSLYMNLSIYDNIYFFGKAYGLSGRNIKSRINYLGMVLNLGDMSRKLKHLSGGYQRRVSLAAALIGDPEIIILDEALVGIDLETKKIILKLLMQLKKEKTLIFTTHSMDEAQQICDYVCFMHRGTKIKEGWTRDILEDFASTHSSTIKVSFATTEYAKDAEKSVKSKNANVWVEGRTLYMESLSGEYDISNMLRLISDMGGYKSVIKGIEVVKPTLGDVMLDLIERGER